MAATKDVNKLAKKIATIDDDRRDWLTKAPSIKNLPQRKRYENFDPYPSSIPINKDNPGGSPEVTGADRVYALFQHALDNNLDFARVFAHDREYFPDRTPNVLEFDDDKFELFPGSSGGHHWRKAKPTDTGESGELKDGWKHVSVGTRYGNDIFDLLSKGNFK